MKVDKKAFIGFAILVVVCLVGLIWVIIGQEMVDRANFSQQICENLVKSGIIAREQCHLSSEVPDVMESLFPFETDITLVQIAMKGFDLNSTSSGRSSSCSQWIRLDYIIIHRWAFLSDESYEFIFCNEKLIDREWHE